MADAPLGASFVPGADQGLNTGTNPGGLSPQAQQAIQFLSLRLPTIVGAQAPSPQALLQPQGHVGANHDLASAVVRSVLAALGHPVPLGGPSSAATVLSGGGTKPGGSPFAPTSDPGVGGAGGGGAAIPKITIGDTGTPQQQPTSNTDPVAPAVKLPTSDDIPSVPPMFSGGPSMGQGGAAPALPEPPPRSSGPIAY